VEQAEEPVMPVVHLPHLSRLAALLLTDAPERDIVTFLQRCVVCLERQEERFAVSWA
jgi:phosphohistidine phosphatase SixA